MQMEQKKEQKKERNTRENRGSGIGVVLAILALVAVIVTAGSGLIYLFKSYQEATLESQKNQLINISESVANNIAVYLENYQETAESLVAVDQFREASESLVQGDSRALERFFGQAMENRSGDIVCMAYETADGRRCSVGTQDRFSCHKELGTDDVFQELEIDRDHEGSFYFRICAEDAGRGRLLLYLPLSTIYGKNASTIHMGENGYVMIKDSEGIILMHPVEAQIGMDVLDDRKRMYPDFDYAELEVLIGHQLAGESGVEVYHSYWWADDPPPAVRKVSAYLPIRLGTDFLSVSAVMDYNEIAEPVQSVGLRILFMTVILVITLLIFLMTLWRSLSRQRTMERENDRLKRINEELERLHQQEEALAQQQRLQLIGTMTSGIAHEFNNLLTPIMGYSAILLENTSPTDDNYADLQEIYGSAEKAKEIIDQITQFSRKNAEKMFEPIHIGDAVKKALLITEAAKPRQITMNTALDTERDVCLGNPVQIYQMVVNLCNNAMQAMGDQPGTLTIVGEAMQPVKNRDAFFHGKEKEWFYRISVTDTGCGMSRETQEKIFVPFFTTKKPGEGTGLGLSIVQRLVEAHGGYICVHSTPGEGTTFVIYLPLLTESAEAEPASLQ